MIGELPTSLYVGGEKWEIRSDYRIILRIFEAMEDKELSESEKLYVALDLVYVNFGKMPKALYKEAYEKASAFMECHDRSDDKKNPRLINWEKDEHMIFPAINAVAGCEVRSIPYMHWWTFLGYFESVDNESLWSFVLSIRQKKAHGKKLEKYEQDFYKKNMALCDVKKPEERKTAEQMLNEMFESLDEG